MDDLVGWLMNGWTDDLVGWLMTGWTDGLFLCVDPLPVVGLTVETVSAEAVRVSWTVDLNSTQQDHFTVSEFPPLPCQPPLPCVLI